MFYMQLELILSKNKLCFTSYSVEKQTFIQQFKLKIRQCNFDPIYVAKPKKSKT